MCEVNKQYGIMLLIYSIANLIIFILDIHFDKDIYTWLWLISGIFWLLLSLWHFRKASKKTKKNDIF